MIKFFNFSDFENFRIFLPKNLIIKMKKKNILKK